MTQTTLPTLPSSIGPTSAGGTVKKSESHENFSGTFRVQLEGKVQEPSANSASTLAVQAGQEQVAEPTQAASATLAGTRGATAAPKLMQPFATSHDVIATEALADHAPQGVFTEATGVLEPSVAIPGSQTSGAVVTAVAAPTHIVRPTGPSSGTTSPIGQSNGAKSPIGASSVGANQAGAVAPTVSQVGVGAVQSDIAPDKRSSRQNFAPPSESSTPALTQASPVVRAATSQSSGTASPIGVSGVGANQVSAVAPGAAQSAIAPDKGSSWQNFAPPSESSTPALTQASPVARAATGQSSGTASPIGVSGVGANQVSAVAPGAAQSAIAPDKGSSWQNFAPPSESSTPALTQASPVARAATGQSSGTASPIGMNGTGANQASPVAPGVVQSDAAADTGLSRQNLVHASESSIPVPTPAAPSARAATGQSSDSAKSIRVSSDGENQVSVIAPAAGRGGAGTVQFDAAADTGLSRHHLVRASESSIPAPTQVAPPARPVTGQSSGTASPIRVSGDGDNQASAILPAAGEVRVGAVQSDGAPDKELSLHNLARRTETSIPAPGHSAVEVVPAVASTATEVQRNFQSPPLPFAVDTPLSNPGWGSAMAARLVWGATQGMQSASIEINPRDLGPVSVNLNVVGEEATITFVSQHALVREALEAALPRLRELFSGEGLNLGEVDISSGEGRSNGNDDTTTADDMQSKEQADAQADSAATPSSDEARTHQHDSLVDTFA